MSNRRNDYGNGEAAFGCLLIIGHLLYRWFRTPPEKKMLQFNTVRLWGSPIEGVACSHCQTVCETLDDHCFDCGEPLAVKKPVTYQIKSNQAEEVGSGRLFWIIWGFGMLFFIFFVFIFA